MTETKFYLKVREFCTEGNLLVYEEIVKELLNQIIGNGCEIAWAYNLYFSEIGATEKGGKIIRIADKQEREAPIEVIWDILHEYGHYLSGNAEGTEKTIERENEAWERGKTVLLTYPILSQQLDQYIKYWKKKLLSYEIYQAEKNRHKIA